MLPVVGPDPGCTFARVCWFALFRFVWIYVSCTGLLPAILPVKVYYFTEKQRKIFFLASQLVDNVAGVTVHTVQFVLEAARQNSRNKHTVHTHPSSHCHTLHLQIAVILWPELICYFAAQLL